MSACLHASARVPRSVDALLQEGGLNSTFATTLRQECIVRTVSLFAFGLFPPLLLALDVFAECFVLRCKAARFGTVVGSHLFRKQLLQIGATFSESPLELLEMIFRLSLWCVRGYQGVPLILRPPETP